MSKWMNEANDKCSFQMIIFTKKSIFFFCNNIQSIDNWHFLVNNINCNKKKWLTLPQLMYSTAVSRKKKYTKSPLVIELTKFGAGWKRERKIMKIILKCYLLQLLKMISMTVEEINLPFKLKLSYCSVWSGSR